MHRVIAVTALGLVLASACFFVALGVSALLRPALAARFLGGFATSQSLHFIELAVRILIGSAFVVAAPAVAFSPAIACFGWVLIGTSLVLGVVPWRVHQRFAAWSVPLALPYLPLIGIASLVGGVALIAAVIVPRAVTV